LIPEVAAASAAATAQDRRRRPQPCNPFICLTKIRELFAPEASTAQAPASTCPVAADAGRWGNIPLILLLYFHLS